MKISAALSCLLSISTIGPVSAANGEPTTISFPIPDRPEGITNGPGSTLLVGQIPSGKVLSIDARTGETKEVVGEQQPLGTRQAWGLWYYNGAIFVGGGGPSFGGGTPQVYVYSATNGTQLATCEPLSINTDINMTFINDVTVVGGTAYATDSFNNKLMTFDADEAINNGNCVVSEVGLPEAFKAKDEEEWGANGLVEYADGLLVVHETGGFVNHISNLEGDSPTFQEVIPTDSVATGDGLNVLGDKLYITMNYYRNTISVFQLEQTGGTVSAIPLTSITSAHYYTPATSAVYCGYIYSANSLFATHDITDSANDTVVGVKNMYDECVVDSETPVAAPENELATTLFPTPTKPPVEAPTPSDTTDPTTISYPIPDRPEGITNGPGSTLLVGQIPSGKVLSIDARTGETKEVVGGQQPPGTRQAWGLWYYNGAIFVGGGGPSFGGGTPQVYVYSATDGTQLVTCEPLSINTDINTTFINDVTVVGNTAYATDSFNNKLMSFDADEAINNGNCVVSEVGLPKAFKAKDEEEWGANGLVEYADGLLVVHETGGFVYHIGNLDSDSPTFQEVIPAGAATGDGLNVLEDKLYITMNFANKIGVFQLGVVGGTITGTPVASITSPVYKTPATSALYCGYIYSANSLFATHDITDSANDTVVGVKNMYDSCAVDSDATKPPTAAPPSPGFTANSSLGVVSATVAMVCMLLF